MNSLDWLTQDRTDPSIRIPFPHIVEANNLMDEVELISDWNQGVENPGDLGRTAVARNFSCIKCGKKSKWKKFISNRLW